MPAKIIEEAVISSPQISYTPLSGAELKAAIMDSVKKSLDGEHGLFSVGRAWPGCEWTLVIHAWGQDDEVIESPVVSPPEGLKETCVTAKGNSEPPDEIRESLGIKPKPRTRVEFPEDSKTIKISRRGE